jgi:hypothetical protein
MLILMGFFLMDACWPSVTCLRLHMLPECLAHTCQKLPFEIVAVRAPCVVHPQSCFLVGRSDPRAHRPAGLATLLRRIAGSTAMIAGPTPWGARHRARQAG